MGFGLVLAGADLESLAAVFAERQERNAVYDESDLRQRFADTGFDDVQCDVVDIFGKTFARVSAS